MGGNSKKVEFADRLGLPIELMAESESFVECNEIYPDNAETVRVFDDMLTQWRVGTNGVIGLDYNVLPFVFRTRKIPVKNRPEVLDCLKVMEQAAMDVIKGKR